MPPRLGSSNRLLLAATFVAALAFCACGRTPKCGDGTPEGQAKCPAAVCGNGVVEAPEQCDDGNTTSGDGCEADCTKTATPVCGNGVIEGNEQCDDGTAKNGTAGDPCLADCTKPVCGNGTLEGTEQCDDGNAVSGDGCEADCTPTPPSVCGNDKLEMGELCDDGNRQPGDGCESDCTPTTAEVKTCPGASLPALTDGGTCDVLPGDSGKLFTGTVLTPGTVYKGGQVLVDGNGVIACVACDCSGAAGASTATQVTCPQGVISPGLINLHDHITYQDPPYVSDAGTNERYEHRNDWRRGENGHTEIDNGGSKQGDPVRWGELRQVMAGETSITGSGGADGLLRNLDKPSEDPGYANQEGLGEDYADFDTFPLGDSGGIELSGSCAYPDTPSMPPKGVYEPHVAEGINAAARNEFLCEDGITSDQWSPIITNRTAILHGVGLRGGDVARVALAGAGLVWAPRSNIALYGDTAPVLEYYHLGVPIALGTDWLQSGSMNLLRELQCASSFDQNYLNGALSERFLWKAVTSSAADIIHMSDKIGRLAPGKVADIAIFREQDPADPYGAVIDAQPQDVVLTMRGGTALYGDQAVVDALASGCDSIPGGVCGSPKAACVSSEISKSFSTLSTAEATAYPLFACGTPPDEPTCVPDRDLMWTKNGSTSYAGTVDPGTDSDGDGIPDSTDDCPVTFNPIRPEDNGVQSDVDGDLVGDACDVCPVTPGTQAGQSQTCTAPDPNDYDGDNIPNASDKCPNDPDPSNSDLDDDGIGDACDACPNDANTLNGACPVTIYDVTTPEANGSYHYMGVKVALAGVVVTGVIPSSGFFVQVPDTGGTYVAQHSGLFVYMGSGTSDAGVAAGDVIDIGQGFLKAFYGQLELSSVDATDITHDTSSTATVPAPEPVDAADLADGAADAKAYESVLVTVADVTVTDTAPTPGGGDKAPYNDFVISNKDGTVGPRVDDELYLISPAPVEGELFSSITGIHDYVHDHFRIEPRDAADVVVGPPVITSFGFGTADAGFTRVGDPIQDTFPQPLVVTLSRAADSPVTITVTASPADVTLADGGVFTISAGGTSTTIPMTGVTQDSDVALTASLDAGQPKTAHVQVLAATQQASLVSVTPDPANVGPGTKVTFTVTMDVPPAADTTVTLSIDPPTGFGALSTTSLTIPKNQLSATFDVNLAADATGSGTVMASYNGAQPTAAINIVGSTGLVINEVDYDQSVSGDTNEFVEIYNSSGLPISLQGLDLVLVNGSSSVLAEYDRYPLTSDGGTLAPGAYLVVGTQALLATVPSCPNMVTFKASGNNIQNGAPDALAIQDTQTDTLLDSLSYEDGSDGGVVASMDGGTFALREGDASTASLADSNSVEGSLSRLPNGTDTNVNATDFQFTGTPTPCGLNQL